MLYHCTVSNLIPRPVSGILYPCGWTSQSSHTGIQIAHNSSILPTHSSFFLSSTLSPPYLLPPQCTYIHVHIHVAFRTQNPPSLLPSPLRKEKTYTLQSVSIWGWIAWVRLGLWSEGNPNFLTELCKLLDMAVVWFPVYLVKRFVKDCNTMITGSGISMLQSENGP